MERRSFIKTTAAMMIAAPAGLAASSARAQDKKFTIALIPGLTTDAFYITMRKGAEAAAKAVGADLVFQGAPDFNPVTQVPVLDAVIAKQPSAILIAPTDKTQLVQPLKKAVDAGIPVFTVDTFIGTGVYQTGAGDADFPISYIASDNILGGEIAARALATAIGDKGKVYRLSGEPIVTMVDGPVTGGYPILGVVARADHGRLAQLVPGDAVGFEAVTIAAARAALDVPEPRIEIDAGDLAAGWAGSTG